MPWDVGQGQGRCDALHRNVKREGWAIILKEVPLQDCLDRRRTVVSFLTYHSGHFDFRGPTLLVPFFVVVLITFTVDEQVFSFPIITGVWLFSNNP